MGGILIHPCLLLFLVFSLAFCWEGVDDSDVLVLSEKNFAATVNNEELMLVEFYAPWCGHCKHLAPEYAKAATELKGEGIKLAKVDATEETSLGSKYGVSGYPTLKVFRNGEAFEYKGPREATGIVQYMRKQVGPSSKVLTSAEEAKQVLEGGEATVVAGFFVSKSDSDQKIFLKVADELREKFKFAHSNSEEVLNHFKYRSAVVLFRPDEPKQLVFQGRVSESALTDWISKNALPTAGVVTKSTVELYQRKGLPLLKLFVDVDVKANKKQTDYYLNRLRKAAKEYPGLSFALAESKEFAEDRDRFGLSGSEPHQMVIEDFSSSEKYKSAHADKFSVDHVKKFCEDYTKKVLKPYIKSEPIPKASKPGEVAVVVGETFNDIVLDPTKDVLIEFYAPWCGHCKNLAPKYEELAKEFKDIDSVVIAKIDATANDASHPAYRANGYPTILYAPANNKDSPVKYEGEREVAAMKKFVLDKGATTAALKGKKKGKK